MTHTRCNLHRILAENGISQKEFSTALGVPQCQVSKWANSYNYPTVGSVLDVLAALERMTGKKWAVNDVWKHAAARTALPYSMIRHNAETTRVSKIAAKVRRRAVA